MRIQITKTLLIFIFLLINIINSSGQTDGESKIKYFSTRINYPVNLKTQESMKKFTIIAYNKSAYPYSVRIKFTKNDNIYPIISSMKEIVYHGRKIFLDLRVQDGGRPWSFEYTYDYEIGNKEKPELEYPYILPIKIDKKVESWNFDYSYNFKMEFNDSVYCMRRGIVTAIPDVKVEAERIFDNGTLEVFHNDGTIAVYKNITKESCNLIPGDIVYPGQVVGLINEDRILNVELYEINDEKSVKSIEINFIGENYKLVKGSDINNEYVFYPCDIIEKEMTKKEKKKRKENIPCNSKD